MKTIMVLLAVMASFTCFSQVGQGTGEETPEEKICSVVDEPSQFPGGSDALEKYLKRNLQYPIVARELGLQGKCYLKFVISAEGKVRDVSVTRGVPDCPECDKEAVRVVRGMPAWKPAKVDGKPVSSYYYLPVRFKLESESE